VSIAESGREGAGRGGVAECFGEEVALRERVSAIVENELGFTSSCGEATGENQGGQRSGMKPCRLNKIC